MATPLVRCRLCGNDNLVPVLDLGDQVLTGVFPRHPGQTVSRGPLCLVKCLGAGACGLVQLAHSFDLGEMYGDNYGYRSGLNPTMVQHLHAKVARILERVEFGDAPIVLDIGSNDGTTLAAYPAGRCTRVGIDPTAAKFRRFYPDDVVVIPEFFAARRFEEAFPGRRARVITSFSMLYDLEQPLSFVREVASLLDERSVWVFEQSYMPLMLERNAWDTVCHEHLEYYGLAQIDWMTRRCGLKIIDIEFSDINGGSVSVTAARADAAWPESAELTRLLAREVSLGLDGLEPFLAFARRALAGRDALREYVVRARADGRRVAALGASTKGNVLLQYCGFTLHDIEAVGEINQDKIGAFTPGTLLPIVDERTLLADEPDELIVLPWHFRDFFVGRYRLARARLVFPLPVLEVVSPTPSTPSTRESA